MFIQLKIASGTLTTIDELQRLVYQDIIKKISKRS